ncbi:hypothetical protein PYW07_002180 [Mythimna separata]|uniref:Uncharacterized protein n=1 Tax=Mythimna separata TaxID=271217 RepID=A0AAD8DT74_MYTSE|nr:hypothetical protein PYW07_002180 [Mythimna separata]
MNRKKNRSSRSTSTSTQRSIVLKLDNKQFEESYISLTDTLVLKVFSLRVSDLDLRNFAVKVSFFDVLLLHAVIKPIHVRDADPVNPVAKGSMNFDPADYEKMCLFADTPLIAQIHPLRKIDENVFLHPEQGDTNEKESAMDVSCCNVDIMPIFTTMKEKQKMVIKKRMEPMVLPSVLKRKSWDTLPLLTMELTVERHPLNQVHHKVLKDANWMTLTLVGSYNMIVPFGSEYLYTAASNLPNHGPDDAQLGIVTFSQGYKKPRGFKSTNFFPKWESLRGSGEVFTQGDQKFSFQLEDLQNDDDIDLLSYLDEKLPYYTVVWGSFHRTLMFNRDRWLWEHLRQYKWPLELHIYGEQGGFSFMAFLNLFRFLYPGEQAIRLAVPLHWVHAETMMKECNCDLLLTPNDTFPGHPSDQGKVSKSRVTNDTFGNSESSSSDFFNRVTGPDGNNAFVVIEVRLGRPLVPVILPKEVLKEDISAMLTKMELEAPRKRICTGRGQLEHEWQKTVRSAANSLRKVPYYGATEFCTFNRQLSETRTRVELTTSCWQDAAIFVNNNFVVQSYLESDALFEELVMMSHACLMKSASNTLIRTDHLTVEVEPAIRAARQARQMQDIGHAIDIYLRLIAEKPRVADYWRELSTCMKDFDTERAKVCLNRAVFIYPRHPLSLISKGAMLFEENPAAAEPFFIALMTYHPNWTSAWVIASVYFYNRELFHLAKVTMSIAEKWRNLRCEEDVRYQRAWEHELGDWWDSTPVLPHMSLYYTAADLLLRLRAMPLAEVCIAQILSVAGESPQYYHLVSLCCRLQERLEDALCHITVGIKKFGEVTYLTSLQAEIQHKLGNFNAASELFGKADNGAESYTALMSLTAGDNPRARGLLLDRVRTRPSAYAWAALAEDWLANPPPVSTTNVKVKVNKKRIDLEGVPEDGVRDATLNRHMKAKSSAIACAIQALKIDRQAGRAWAILGALVRPKAKRLYCLKMAQLSGWTVSEEYKDVANVASQFSICHYVGASLRECRCGMSQCPPTCYCSLCENTRV